MRKNIFKHCFKSIKPNREKKYNMVLVYMTVSRICTPILTMAHCA